MIIALGESIVATGIGAEVGVDAGVIAAYLHLPMVAGIVLLALGLKKTLGDVSEPHAPPAH